MATKRLRVFAGPNGSGKSTIYKNLLEKGEVNLGVFVNADEIEKALRWTERLDFTSYRLLLNFTDFCERYKSSSYFEKSDGAAIIKSISFAHNYLVISDTSLIDSYFAAFITDYIRVNMLDSVDVFSIETVMTHPSKIDFIKLARQKGYRVYLYFVSTRDVKVNVDRVASRVKEGGHPVSEGKIRSRYARSMDNLYEALIHSTRAYIFDNSGSERPIWYLESDGKGLYAKEPIVPAWIHHYLIEKL